MMEVRASYPFTGSFAMDSVASQAAGRMPDFSGAGFGERDLGWIVGSEIEAQRIKRNLDRVGMKAEIREDGSHDTRRDGC